MNSSPKLAIVIYDNCQYFDRKFFTNSLIKNTAVFDVTFYYIGHSENLGLYDLTFEKKLLNPNPMDHFNNLLVDISNKFDYFLFITPIITIQSTINSNTIDFNKTNYLLNTNFLVFTNKKHILDFILYFHFNNNQKKLSFDFVNPGVGTKIINTFNFKVKNNFQMIYEGDNDVKIKRIGVVFTGISHDNGSHLSGWKAKFKRSFLDCFQNHFDKIIIPFGKQNVVQTFVTTYDSDKIIELRKIYNPISLQIIKPANMRIAYIKSIEDLIVKAPKIDFFICTRFDIKFYDELTSWNIDYNKFNFIFEEDWGSEESKEVTDVLFAFPNKFLGAFRESLVKADKNPRRKECIDLHFIYEFVKLEIGVENINFICKEKQSTANATFKEQKQNDYFYLCRTPIDGCDN